VPARDPAAPITAPEIVASLRGAPGAYVHIPFCERLCPFCPYNKELFRPARETRYFAALREEARWYAEALGGPFTSLYIGGGTPTLCLDELSRVIELLPVSGERAIEVHPMHATPDRLDRLRSMGISFVSLGIQSFDGPMLRHLARPGSPETNLRAIEQAVGRFDCVDADLIFDVAFEAPNVFLADLERCFRFGADQVSTYPLMRFGYAPFGKAPHDAQTEHDVLRRATDLAERWGYERRSVWTFNRRGSSSYTSITRPFYLGLGAGGASFTGRLFAVNEFSVHRYADAVERGALPVARTLSLRSPADSAYYLFWQAYAGGFQIADLERHFGRLPTLLWRTVARLCAWAGYLRRNGEAYRLTDAGFDTYHDLERWVTYRYIEPLWADMQPARGLEAAEMRRRRDSDGHASV
jgi:oxygen-independent coproporphyrinogen-3 oxidase